MQRTGRPPVKCTSYNAVISDTACRANITAAEKILQSCRQSLSKGAACRIGRAKNRIRMDRLITCSKCSRAAGTLIYMADIEGLLTKNMKILGRTLSAVRNISKEEDADRAREIHALEEKIRRMRHAGRDTAEAENELKAARLKGQETMWPDSHSGAFGGRVWMEGGNESVLFRAGGVKENSLPNEKEI